MILYKYVSFDTGRRILETNTLGFSQPRYFNDPFDMPAYPREARRDPLDSVVDQLRVMAKEHAWSENTGILSLTRTPTNPLMWAHYADKHRGMVIGIDVVAAGLTQESSNLIPAQYGSVIYTSHRPTQPFIGKPDKGLSVGQTHHFPHEHYEKLQRLFLHKPLCWSYEEEVRVIKCLKGISREGSETPSGKLQLTETWDGQPLFLLSLAPEALREVHFGFRSDHQGADEFSYVARGWHPHIAILECSLLPGTFAIETSQYTTIAEGLAG